MYSWDKKNEDSLIHTLIFTFNYSTLFPKNTAVKFQNLSALHATNVVIVFVPSGSGLHADPILLLLFYLKVFIDMCKRYSENLLLFPSNKEMASELIQLNHFTSLRQPLLHTQAGTNQGADILK